MSNYELERFFGFDEFTFPAISFIMENFGSHTAGKGTKSVHQNQNIVCKKVKCDVFHHSRKTCLADTNCKRKTEPDSHFSVKSTPPNFSTIRNPFEAGLPESLHLPLICSPLLFQRPRSPGNFEWTIDDVSSLNPVNVEPNETQFHSVSDPELEAKAQAAINSYFKDQLVVPSPIDCILRKQKIELSSDLEKSVGKKSVRRIRDGACQTELTLPPNLPQEIEKLLTKYCTFVCNQQQSPAIGKNGSITSQDISLRRKLFEYSIHVDEDVDTSLPPDLNTSSPAPTTPELNMPLTRSYSLDNLNICGKHEYIGKSRQIQEEKHFFGSLSPIAKFDIDRINESLTEKIVDKSDSDTQGQYKLNEKNDSVCARSTPENLKQECLSPKNKNYKDPIVETRSIRDNLTKFSNKRCQNLNAVECFEMQSSQLSTKSNSSSSSSQNGGTPMSKRRSPSRKNLSRSFSCHYSDSDNDNDKENNLVTLNKSIPGFMDFGSKMEPTIKWL